MQMVMVSLNYWTEIEIRGIRNETEPSVSSTTVSYAAIGTSIMTAVSCTDGQSGIFLYLIYHDFAKIYGPTQILQKYTSGAVAHGVRDITPWAAALGAARSGPLAVTPRATALSPCRRSPRR
jgi:hypothetical protein